MLLTYKLDFMQHLQKAYASYLHDSVANHQMPFSHSCLPPFTAPFYTSYHKWMNELFILILTHWYPINLNINCYYVIKIIEMIW
jgi:hypothetical protein